MGQKKKQVSSAAKAEMDSPRQAASSLSSARRASLRLPQLKGRRGRRPRGGTAASHVSRVGARRACSGNSPSRAQPLRPGWVIKQGEGKHGRIVRAAFFAGIKRADTRAIL